MPGCLLHIAFFGLGLLILLPLAMSWACKTYHFLFLLNAHETGTIHFIFIPVCRKTLKYEAEQNDYGLCVDLKEGGQGPLS